MTLGLAVSIEIFQTFLVLGYFLLDLSSNACCVRDAQLLVSTTVPNFVLALTLAITTYNILKMTLKYHNFPGLTIKFHDFPGLEN